MYYFEFCLDHSNCMLSSIKSHAYFLNLNPSIIVESVRLGIAADSFDRGIVACEDKRALVSFVQEFQRLLFYRNPDVQFKYAESLSLALDIVNSSEHSTGNSYFWPYGRSYIFLSRADN